VSAGARSARSSLLHLRKPGCRLVSAPRVEKQLCEAAQLLLVLTRRLSRPVETAATKAEAAARRGGGAMAGRVSSRMDGEAHARP
jgi:hypothetical protein